MTLGTVDTVVPVWRSLLFVPATNLALIEKAHTRGADAIILDLEDSVPQDQKSLARDNVAGSAEKLRSRGVDVLVRVNAEDCEKDVRAACCDAISALVIPKVGSAKDVKKVATILDEQDAARPTRLIAQIESVHALANLDSIAGSSQRLHGMSLGSEDFSVSTAMTPNSATLFMPNQMVVFACRRAGIEPYGMPASIAQFRDTDALELAAQQAAEMGMGGAFCIHPNQVAAINNALTPTEQEIAEAAALLDKYEQVKRAGDAVFALDGKMVDLPVVKRAKTVSARAAAISTKQFSNSNS